MATKGGSGGGSSGAKGIRAGASFIELFADDSRLARTLSGLKTKLQNFGKFVGKIGLGMSAAGAGLLAPLTALLKGGVDRADQIGDIADVFGLTADEASRMASAFEMAGGTIEDLETALTKLSLSPGASGNLYKDFLDTADAIDQIADASERMKAAEPTFGSKFSRKFIDSAGDVAGFVKNAPGLSEVEIKNAKALNIELARTGIILKSALLPALEIIGPVINGFLKFVQANAQVLQAAAAVGVGLVVLGTALSAAGLGMAALAIAGKVVAVTIGFLLSPLGLVTAAAVGLGIAWVRTVQSGQAFAADIVSAFMGMSTDAIAAWEGIVNALKKGDLQLAGEVAVAGLKTVWAEGMLFLTIQWTKFKVDMIGGLGEILEVVKALVIGLGAIGTGLSSIKIPGAAGRKLKSEGMEINGIKDAFQASVLGWLTLWRAAPGMQGWDKAAQMGRDDWNQLKQMKKEEEIAEDQANKVQIGAAEADLAKAKAELAALLAKANAPKDAPPSDVSHSIQNRLPSMEAVYGQMRGAFGGPMASQQFAYGDKIDKDSQKIAKATAVLPDMKKLMEKLIRAVEDKSIFV